MQSEKTEYPTKPPRPSRRDCRVDTALELVAKGQSRGNYRSGAHQLIDEHDQSKLAYLCSDNTPPPVMICLLGNFRLLTDGKRIPMRAGGKGEALLAYLGLQYDRRITREQLVQMLWPTSEPALGLRSLNSLVYNLHKLLGPALGDATPVLHEDGYYQLNVEAGIAVDVTCFDRLVATGDQQLQEGNEAAGIAAYHQAAELYRGDLCITVDAQSVVERERLLSRYLTLLTQLAQHAYNAGDYSRSLAYLWQLLARDPCREDAHRLVMRCHVRRGERGTALRQYQVCVDLLRTEFDAAPERATFALFEQIRLAPDTI